MQMKWPRFSATGGSFGLLMGANSFDTGVFNLDGLSVTGVVLSASTSAANGINYATVNLEPATLAAVPEPSGWTLLGAGLIGIIALRRRQATS